MIHKMGKLMGGGGVMTPSTTAFFKIQNSLFSQNFIRNSDKKLKELRPRT